MILKKYDTIKYDGEIHTIRAIINETIIQGPRGSYVKYHALSFQEPDKILLCYSTEDYKVKGKLRVYALYVKLHIMFRSKFFPTNRIKVGDNVIGDEEILIRPEISKRLPKDSKGKYIRFRVDKVCPITKYINDVIPEYAVELVRRKIRNYPKAF